MSDTAEQGGFGDDIGMHGIHLIGDPEEGPRVLLTPDGNGPHDWEVATGEVDLELGPVRLTDSDGQRVIVTSVFPEVDGATLLRQNSDGTIDESRISISDRVIAKGKEFLDGASDNRGTIGALAIGSIAIIEVLRRRN